MDLPNCRLPNKVRAQSLALLYFLQVLEPRATKRYGVSDVQIIDLLVEEEDDGIEEAAHILRIHGLKALRKLMPDEKLPSIHTSEKPGIVSQQHVIGIAC